MQCSTSHIEEEILLVDGHTKGLLFRPGPATMALLRGSRVREQAGQQSFDYRSEQERIGLVLLCSESDCCGASLIRHALGAIAASLACQGYLGLLTVVPAEPSDPAACLAQLKGAITYLRGTGSQRVAAIGFCGGCTPLADAASVDSLFEAGVALFPQSVLPFQQVAIMTPLLYIFKGAPEGQEQLNVLSRTQSSVSRRLRLVGSDSCTDENVHSELLKSKEVLQELLSWLALHLSPYSGDWDIGRISSSAPQSSSWWPAGEGKAFYNVGYAQWQEGRSRWRLSRQPKPAPPPHIPFDVVMDGLASSQRSYELPGHMTLPDIVEILNDIWSDY